MFALCFRSRWQKVVQWFLSQFGIRSNGRWGRGRSEDVESGRCEATAPQFNGEEGEGVEEGEGEVVKGEVEEGEGDNVREGEGGGEGIQEASESREDERKDEKYSIGSADSTETL